MADRPRSSYMPWFDAPPRSAPERQPRGCDDCRHFQPNPHNPAAGVGHCAIGHGTHYPMQRHWCGDHNSERSHD